MSSNYKITLKFEKQICTDKLHILEQEIKKGLFQAIQQSGWTCKFEKQKIKTKPQIEILARFPASKILDLVKSKVEFFEFKDYKFSIAKKRYFIFANNPFCVCCGIEGVEMVLEKPPHDSVPHFNLYAYDENKEPILMTKDHINPVSKGGTNHEENLQTMCSKCNNLKSNSLLDPEQIKDLRILYDNYDKKIKSDKDRRKIMNVMKFLMEKQQ